MQDETVREARGRFLRENGLSEATYGADRFLLHLGPWTIATPNPGLLPYHDLHHVATGYASGVIGEAEISVFELRTGRGSWLTFVLCLGAVAIGLLAAPRRMARAWRGSRGAHGLYHTTVPYDALLAMTVRELRSMLHLPAAGLSAESVTFHEH